MQSGAPSDDLDTNRVGIIGWSFGGYLSALAVLDRPDVFHAAVGAPVTEWRLYDAFYTERYLGDPTRQSDAYDRSSLLPPGVEAGSEKLLVIHGMVDDNVTVAHSLRCPALCSQRAGRTACCRSRA